jgi:hypothetical protein
MWRDQAHDDCAPEVAYSRRQELASAVIARSLVIPLTFRDHALVNAEFHCLLRARGARRLHAEASAVSTA